MNVHDWALIAFSILVKMSVGAVWVLGVTHYLVNRKYGMQEADRLSDRALLALVPVIALAFIASLFHLGDPLNAYRAVTNFGSSWLSREILSGVIFAVLTALFAFFQWRKIGSFLIRNIVAWIAALVGLLFVYSMSQVYMVASQPAWNTWSTPVTFFATTFLLGSLAMGVAFVTTYAYVHSKDPDCADVQCTVMRESVRWISVFSILLVGVEFVVLPIYIATLAGGSSAAVQSAQLMIGTYGWALTLRLVLAFLGAGVFSVFLYQTASTAGREKMLSNLAYAAFGLVLVAEVLGRFLFYATNVRIGI